MTPSLAAAWSALGAAVVHFLWQGALIGLVAAAALALLRRGPATARHAVVSLALLACPAAFVGTFLALLSGSPGEGVLPASLPARLFGPALELGAGVAETVAAPRVAEVAAWGWALGVLGMALRFALAGRSARRLRTVAVDDPGAAWRRAFDALRRDLGVARAVRLVRSGLAEVPMVVGWLSPVVLVPASAFTTLSPDQLKALLAHELAHVRRHDPLVNAIQAVVEVVLFFHPVVWWISRQVRVEREFCCDESALQVTGSPRLLAEALARMEALRCGAHTRPGTGPVLASNGGSLMKRIEHILGVRSGAAASPLGWQLPLGLLVTGVLALAGTAYAAPALARDDAASAQTGSDDARGAARRREVAVKREAAVKRELEALEAELAAAVLAGELTREQADQKLVVSRKGLARKLAPSTSREDAGRVRLERYLRDVEAAVAAGELTSEEARPKVADLRRRIAATSTSVERFVGTGSGTTARRADDLAGAKRRIQAELKAGRISAEEAKQRLASLERALSARDVAIKKEAAAVQAGIDAAVEQGRLTPEEGKARFEAWKQSVAVRKQGAGAGSVEVVKRKLDELVRSGRITQEQADQRLAVFLKSWKERAAGGGERR